MIKKKFKRTRPQVWRFYPDSFMWSSFCSWNILLKLESQSLKLIYEKDKTDDQEGKTFMCLIHSTSVHILLERRKKKNNQE